MSLVTVLSLSIFFFVLNLIVIGIKKIKKKKDDTIVEDKKEVVPQEPSSDIRIDELPTQNSILPQNKTKTFIHNHQSMIIGYIAWLVIHCTFLLFSDKVVPHKPIMEDPKDYFFPFSFAIDVYDFSEFFVYVIALPIVVYAIYYFIKKARER